MYCYNLHIKNEKKGCMNQNDSYSPFKGNRINGLTAMRFARAARECVTLRITAAICRCTADLHCFCYAFTLGIVFAGGSGTGHFQAIVRVAIGDFVGGISGTLAKRGASCFVRYFGFATAVNLDIRATAAGVVVVFAVNRTALQFCHDISPSIHEFDVLLSLSEQSKHQS